VQNYCYTFQPIHYYCWLQNGYYIIPEKSETPRPNNAHTEKNCGLPHLSLSTNLISFFANVLNNKTNEIIQNKPVLYWTLQRCKSSTPAIKQTALPNPHVLYSYKIKRIRKRRGLGMRSLNVATGYAQPAYYVTSQAGGTVIICRNYWFLYYQLLYLHLIL